MFYTISSEALTNVVGGNQCTPQQGGQQPDPAQLQAMQQQQMQAQGQGQAGEAAAAGPQPGGDICQQIQQVLAGISSLVGLFQQFTQSRQA